jgi:heterodisulfide reductase subunit A2
MNNVAGSIQGSVMVVGGGITGIQTALDLADSGFRVYLVEHSPAIGGMMSWLDKTFPTNDCAMCIMSPKLVEVGRHLNIDILSNTEIEQVDGKAGDFRVKVKTKPRFIDPDVCTGCGQCAATCPVSAVDTYNQNMRDRRAIYIVYPQAVPLSFAIDQDVCIGCGLCENMCLAKAIKYDDQPVERDLDIGSIILCPGTEAYDPGALDFLGYGASPNVVTSPEFERILSASGPYFGHLMRPSDRTEPKKIAWLQCIGSRDINRTAHGYCSSVCCMYAIKEAIIAKEHSSRDLDCAIFYMDMRTYGKDFERCYNDARDRDGVRFIRSRVHTVKQIDGTGDLELMFMDETGQLKTETFDMVVLSVGLQVSAKTRALAEKLDVRLNADGFCQTTSFSPVATSREGIYVSGAFQGPKDIPTSVVDASAASAAAGEILNPARHSRTRVKQQVPERSIFGERPRIGVFVCKCGSNIAGVVDVPAVTDYAATLPHVDYAEYNLYTCSQNTQEDITQVIREKNLNRVIVASCSPKTHDPLFKETLVNAGLNPYLFSMVNIRNLCSWVHKDSPELATQKAKDLVRMTVRAIAFSEPLEEQELGIDQRALVIGGGISGMSAALSLARQGHETHLLEKSPVLGGQARHLFKTWKDEDIQANLEAMIRDVQTEPNIVVHLDTKIADVTGFVGNFDTTVEHENEQEHIAHGVAVVATGAREHKPDEYLYGQDPRVKTGLELDRMLIADPEPLKTMKRAVFIQCVGSRQEERPYCSRVCCTHSIKSALELKKINPGMDVFILYRDIRTYGQREAIYSQARAAGVIFVRYSLTDKPEVVAQDDGLLVKVKDPVLGRPLDIETDLLTLAGAIVPEDNEALAGFYKLPLTEDGFFAEQHVKLGPSQFAIDGMFLCGMAHYPKSIDESIAQGKAAASRAITLLAREKIFSSGEVAKVNPAFCSSCGTCVAICPYSAPFLVEEGPTAGKAQINASLCKGCGLCAASCRSGAIALNGTNMKQVYAMIEAS